MRRSTRGRGFLLHLLLLHLLQFLQTLLLLFREAQPGRSLELILGLLPRLLIILTASRTASQLRVSLIGTRYPSDVYSSSRRDNSTYHAAIPLRQADPGELFQASLLRHRCVRSRSSSYDSVSPRLQSFPLSFKREEEEVT